jgi:hypothetical protein
VYINNMNVFVRYKFTNKEKVIFKNICSNDVFIICITLLLMKLLFEKALERTCIMWYLFLYDDKRIICYVVIFTLSSDILMIEEKSLCNNDPK